MQLSTWTNDILSSIKPNALLISSTISNEVSGFSLANIKTIAQLNGDKFLKRLSNAALETLAIIAYKQPITKGEVESIRGVNSDYSVQKLLEKELILIAGRNEKMPGQPLIYATSKHFMDYFGINSASDLPKIREVLAEQLIEGTLVSPNDFITDMIPIDLEKSDTIVNKSGEIEIQGNDTTTDNEPN